ncbi:MAG: hypothetical protein PHR96_02420 [Clostridia bacterium]|nr:hypothetical protein [Clostridia bacterium]
MAKIQAFVKKKKNKLGKKESWYIFFIVLLSLLLITSLSLLWSNSLYKSTVAMLGQKTLGDTIKLELEDKGSFSQALTFQGSILQNFPIHQEGYLKVKEDQPDCVARVKIFIYNSIQEEPVLLTGTLTTDWTSADDGYYYYKYVLTENLAFKFLHSITSPGDEFDLHSTEIYNIVVTIETLPYSSDFELIWGTTFLEEIT